MSRVGISKLLTKDIYLGLPIMVGKTKRKEFQSIKDRLWKRHKGWHNEYLSGASKATLIQSIVQAVPLYALSYFKFPKSFVNELNMIIEKFW